MEKLRLRHTRIKDVIKEGKKNKRFYSFITEHYFSSDVRFPKKPPLSRASKKSALGSFYPRKKV